MSLKWGLNFEAFLEKGVVFLMIKLLKAVCFLALMIEKK